MGVRQDASPGISQQAPSYSREQRWVELEAGISLPVVANKLGPGCVACFEGGMPVGDKHTEDIVITDGVAIECKAATCEAINK